MTNSILELNLTALNANSPQLAATMRSIDLAGFQAEIVRTKTSAPSLRVISPESGKPELLHSAYDPLREAQRWAESAVLETPTNIAVLGMGLGYHLHTLVKQQQRLLRHLIIIEQDPRIMWIALSSLDMRSIINREGTLFIIGAEPEADCLAEHLTDVRSDMIIHNCHFLSHSQSLRMSPNYYNSIKETLLQMLTHDEVNMRTNMENQGRNQFNIYMNLPAMIKGYALKDCQGLMQGVPAIVSAAGPSLDKNIDQLKALNDNAAVFIVDTAQITFKKHGFIPDVVITADPTPLNFSHFEKIDNLGNSILAFHPESQRAITQKYIDHPYLLPLFDPNIPLLDYLFDLDEVNGRMERAMNVGHIALNLALHMGCSPIILIGFDMAFPRNGGTTHAQDGAVSRTIDPMQQDGTVNIGGKAGKAIAESGKMTLVPGYYGDEVPTTVPFSLYIRALEKTAAQSNVEIIDATEGGALIKGMKRMPLQEALQTHLKDTGVSQRFDSFKQHKPQPPYQEVIDKLKHGRQILEDSVKSCDSLLAMLDRWKIILSQQNLNKQEAHDLFNEFENIWIKMCGQELFDPLLGGSVQHVYFVRQRTARARDDSGNAFLELILHKYSSIVPEMKTIIKNFIQCVDLAQSSLIAHGSMQK